MIFNVGVSAADMADEGFRNNGSKSVLLVSIFLLSLWAPFLAVNDVEDTLDDAVARGFSGPFSLESGFGHDIAGTTLDVDGLVEASVREESMLDLWNTEALNVSFGEHHGTPDLKLTRSDKTHFCWSTQEGSVRTAIHRTGVWATTLVDSVATANASTLVDCALAVTANERPRVLYADGDDLKMGRYAFESATYWEGPQWHTRTIMENVHPTHLELDITPEGLEWGLMRTASGALHQVNFSGAYWTEFLLDAGPVGENFELDIDEDGVAHVLYSRTATNDVVLLRVDGHDRDFRLLLRDADLVDALGMDLDANNIEQVATATQGLSSFSINLIRSLAGQDTGRVDPVPSTALIGENDVGEGHLLMGDLNDDGFDDLVVSTPHASSNGMNQNGRVDVYYGSTSGVASAPDAVRHGSVSGAQMGSGIAVGDFNNDGTADLAIGSPGWAPSDDVEARDGRIQVFLGNASGLTTTAWSTVAGSANESLGSVLAALQRTGTGDGLAVTARNFTATISATQTDHGKVNVFAANTTGLHAMRNMTQSKDGDLFGRSLEA